MFGASRLRELNWFGKFYNVKHIVAKGRLWCEPLSIHKLSYDEYECYVPMAEGCYNTKTAYYFTLIGKN